MKGTMGGTMNINGGGGAMKGEGVNDEV